MTTARQRPEYETCVADTHHDRAGLTWCGQRIGFAFVFVSVDHAAINGRNHGRLIVCRDCLALIIQSLKNGQAREQRV